MLPIKLDQPQANFAPGDLISGTIATSDLPSDTSKLAIRLLWFTTGKGTRDVNTCFEIVQAIGPRTSAQTFEFIAPHRPLSFSGQLISLQWAIEVVAFPSRQSSLAEVVITHSDAEITLLNTEDDLKRLGINVPIVRFSGGRNKRVSKHSHGN